MTTVIAVVAIALPSLLFAALVALLVKSYLSSRRPR